jgi:hypothetical protein
MVDPVTQWFGSGLGQKGSTSNIGACLPEAAVWGVAAVFGAAGALLSLLWGWPPHATLATTDSSAAARTDTRPRTTRFVIIFPQKRS